jgi:hypothetical protein
MDFKAFLAAFLLAYFTRARIEHTPSVPFFLLAALLG